MNIDDLLDTIMLEEAEPSHEALVKWCELFPEHRDKLASFFATWAVQKVLPKGVEIDEAKVADRLVDHALGILRSRTAD